MRRSLALIALLALAGCQSTTPTSGAIDPFFGRTRIEPPATGTVAPPVVTLPSSEAAPAKTPVMPRSGGVPRPNALGTTQPKSPPSQTSTAATTAQPASAKGDRISVPSSARSATNLLASRTTSAAPAAATPVARTPALPPPPPITATSASAASSPPQTIIQTILPRSKVETSAGQPTSASTIPNTWPTPQPASSSQKAVDIMDLPAARPAANARASAATATGVIQTSATLPIDAPSAPVQSFAYDPQYRWLRGRLEYSQIDRAWRLRYIPVDGATDAYGGSVVLAKTSKLSGFQRGDLIEVHGRVLPPNSGGATFAAGYQVDDIQRL